MKRVFTFLFAIAVTASVLAQSPQKMSYQAVIRNSSNQLVTSHAVGMRVSILQGSASGTAVYTETITPTPTTNANGLVSIEIGGGSGFDAISWASGPYFIKTETDPAGGTTYTITGTSQLLSVPYALYASKIANLSGTNTGDQDGSETKITAGANLTVTGTGTTASPYVIGATGGVFTHYVGELYGGGIVVAVWKEGGVEHGLIASLADVSASALWSSITSASIGEPARSPFDGRANTAAIVAQGDASGAAYLCDNYSSGGFNDWYLPAAWELNQCYNAAFVVNTTLGATNGFQFAYYWSSTEYNDYDAWDQGFSDGYAYYYSKSLYYRVRAVRRF